ncbi:MAG: AAA-like domain-containing protein [Candidatus Poribacteria bacterium]
MNVHRPQSASTDVAKFYVAGGTLSPDVPSYISRQADEDLYDGLSGGEFCYVLTSRQMGKSSLMVRTAARLRDAGSTVAMLDVTSVGQQVTPDQWYDGLAMGLGQALDMEDELEAFWLDHERLSPVQRWIETLRAAVLPNIDGPLVVFVDEIDTVRSLPFPTDEFFAAIRACYNRRSQVPEFERLTFCLLGVSTPTDLVRNPQTTPFNIGRRIGLEDFTESDIGALAPGMARLGDSATHVLSRVLHWTGGHPYLTQRLCEAVAKDETASGPADVDRLCDDLYLSRRAREQDTNLTFARDRVLRGGDMEGLDRASVLTLYGQALRGKDAPADDANPVVSLLKIAGLVRPEDGHLRVRNRIYERVFDKTWIRENMPDAELRRQRVAFLKGVLRTAAIAATVVAVVTAFLVHSVRQERRVQTLLTQSRELLSQSQVERGMGLLEADDSLGLLHLVEAADTVGASGEQSEAIASLWAAWEQEHAGELEFLGGHDGGVTDVAYGPDGRRLATTSYDRTVRMWDVTTGDMIGVSEEYDSTTRSVAFHPNGRVLAIGRSDGRIDLLDAQPDGGKLTVIDTLNYHPSGEGAGGQVYGVDFTTDGALLATALIRGGVRLWEVATWVPHGRTIDALGRYSDVALSADGAAVAAQRNDGTVRVWDTDTGLPLLPPIPSVYTTTYDRIAFAPDTNAVIVRTARDAMQMWDIDANQLTGPTFRVPGAIRAVAFSPNGAFVALGTTTGVVTVYDRTTGIERAVLPRHQGGVFAVAFSPDGRAIASASMDGSVRAGPHQSEDNETRPLWDPDSLRAARFSLDGRRLITAFKDGTAQTWDVDTGDRIGPPLSHGEPAVAGLSPDGAIAVTYSANTGIKMWDADTGSSLGEADLEIHAQTTEARQGGLSDAVFGPDGRNVVLRFGGRYLEIWDVLDGPVRAAAAHVDSGQAGVAFSPDGSRLAVSEYGNVAWIWDIASAQRIGPTFHHDRAVDTVAFSPDGTLLATGSRDQRVRVWNVETGEEVVPAMRHAGTVSSVRFAPNGAALATTAQGNLRLWDLGTGKQLGAPRRHGNAWLDVRYAPDGHRIATFAPFGGSFARLWHVATGRLYPLPLRHPDSPHIARPTFSKDGRRLVALFRDSGIFRWGNYSAWCAAGMNGFASTAS